MKFVRNLKIQLKPAAAQDFAKIVAADVLPVLKQQPGFAHELMMVRDDQAVSISVWNDKVSADQYAQAVHPKVLQKLSPWIVGQPVTETYDLTAASL